MHALRATQYWKAVPVYRLELLLKLPLVLAQLWKLVLLFQSLLFSDLLLRLPPLTLFPNLKEGKLIPQRPNAVISLPSLSSGIFDTKIISEIKFLLTVSINKTRQDIFWDQLQDSQKIIKSGETKISLSVNQVCKISEYFPLSQNVFLFCFYFKFLFFLSLIIFSKNPLPRMEELLVKKDKAQISEAC